ncbi:hypothetical protein BD289DRAFT_419690 [Coniella lustricola]|uniref:Uncharacterized protein n=1 Tax=Coniella lustricola TaxID=2025994 RepID=A0A2T3ANI5_9PEZI|nr:hypothetical protein BD289DRAFT_419690 [Coniella lustricola]
MSLLHTSSSTTTMTQSNPKSSTVPLSENKDVVHQYATDLSSAWSCSNEHASAAMLSLAKQFLHINRLLLTYLILGCYIAVLQTMLVMRECAAASATAFARLVWSAWDSKTSRRLRKKLEFEFFVLILGCGNGFALIIFWPGWIFVGLLYLTYLMWSCAT